MEYLAGKDLADYLHQEGALPISVAVEYIMQACEALAAAHAHNIVHRDIKPENLFLTQQAQGMPIIKVLDFGISKIALPRGKRDLVRTQMALGSPVYMSPEQIRRSDQVDARSDIWAIGCVLFELLTGVTAFDEPSLLELSAAILEREPVPLQTLRPDASEELEEVVLRCLQKNPDQRFQNVADLAAALYPFAPRRARISAERCYHMLKNAGIVSTELQLASAYPPPMSSGRVTTTRSVPDAPRTTTPAAIDLTIAEDDAPFAPKKGRKLAVFAAVGVALAAAGLLWARTQNGAGPAAAAAAPPGAPLAAPAAAPTAVPRAAASPDTALPKPLRVMDLDQEIDSANTAAKGSATASPRAKLPKPVRPPHNAASGGKRSRGSDDELDPGF
jgi:serine/threonine-protein kinase